MLVDRGAVLVDADELAREVVEPGTPAWSKIVEHFGPGILLSDKRIDRPRLADIVFHDRAKLALLNEITHPEVMRRIADRLEELKGTDHIVIVDVPLLAEVGASELFDLIVVITASEDAQIERMRTQRALGDVAARARIAAQLPMDERAAVADVVVSNEGSLEQLEQEVDRLWSFLRTEQGGRTAQ